MRQKKRASINKRLKRLLLVCFIPLTIMIVYSLFLVTQISKRYQVGIDNITGANEHNIVFKEDLDYLMYIIAVNSGRASKLVDTDRPFVMIEEARETFTELLDRAQNAEKKRTLGAILHNLDTLERHVTEMEDNAGIVGMYDENMSRLDLDIRILTELIQEDIQNYISDEVKELNELKQEIRLGVQQVFLLGVVILVLVFAIAFFSSQRIMNNLTSSLEELLRVSRKAGKGDFGTTADTRWMDAELAELGEGYNKMVERLKTLVEDIKSEQLNLRITEQRLLQAQINPHFLYNTLDNIVWLAESGEKDQVIMMVTALSDFFRTTLSKGRDYITIEEEESHIRSYLQIQQFRYQDILRYEIHIPKELYPYQILKLTLQPLIENALYHGIKNRRGMGEILVTGKKEENLIWLTVSDNGIGMTREELQGVIARLNAESAEKKSFGLYNVQQRIRLNYGNAYGMEIQSVYGKGTTVTVKIPAQLEEGNR